MAHAKCYLPAISTTLWVALASWMLPQTQTLHSIFDFSIPPTPFPSVPLRLSENTPG